MLYSGTAKDQDVVKSQPFNITRTTAAASTGIALVGILGGILDQVNSLGLNVPAWGLVAIVITAMVMATIASAVDVITRASLTKQKAGLQVETEGNGSAMHLGDMKLVVKQLDDEHITVSPQG